MAKSIKIACETAAVLPIDALEDFQGGLKELSKENSAKLRKEIVELGFSDPISVWKHGKHNYILNGHQRLKVLREMREEGWEIPDLPIVSIHAKTIKEAKKKLLALASQYGSMSMQGFGAYLQDAGLGLKEAADSFSFPELDGTIGRLLNSETTGGRIDQDEVPFSRGKKVTPGEIYELGNHRLICGDATKPDQVEALYSSVPGGRADMIFTDPPYNIDYHGRGRKTSSGMVNDTQSREAFADFLAAAFRMMLLKSKKAAPFYVCHASVTQDLFKIALENCGLNVRATIIWNKTVATMGWGDYRWKHEPIYYAGRGGGYSSSETGRSTRYGTRTGT